MISFGGPQGLADVRPFLENVLRGRRVAPGRIEEVAHHYELFGGVSPLTALTMRQAEALAGSGWPRPGCRCRSTSGCATGIRYLADTLARDVAGRRAPRGGRDRGGASQLLELHAVQGERRRGAGHAGESGPGGRRGDLRRRLAHPPGLHRGQRRPRRGTRWRRLPVTQCSAGAELVFTAHSIPVSMAERIPTGSSSRRRRIWLRARVNAGRGATRSSPTSPSTRAAAAAPRIPGWDRTSAITCAIWRRAAGRGGALPGRLPDRSRRSALRPRRRGYRGRATSSDCPSPAPARSAITRCSSTCWRTS